LGSDSFHILLALSISGSLPTQVSSGAVRTWAGVSGFCGRVAHFPKHASLNFICLSRFVHAGSSKKGVRVSLCSFTIVPSSAGRYVRKVRRWFPIPLTCWLPVAAEMDLGLLFVGLIPASVRGSPVLPRHSTLGSTRGRLGGRSVDCPPDLVSTRFRPASCRLPDLVRSKILFDLTR